MINLNEETPQMVLKSIFDSFDDDGNGTLDIILNFKIVVASFFNFFLFCDFLPIRSMRNSVNRKSEQKNATTILKFSIITETYKM